MLLIISFMGCYGNQTLTRKVYDWNGTIGNRVMKNIVFWALCILPVYETTLFVDFAILNVIEFWTGAQLLTMAEGESEIKIVQTEDRTYQLTMTKGSILIEETQGPEQGQAIELKYDETNQNWYLVGNNGTYHIASVEDGKLNLIYPSGKSLTLSTLFN